MMFSNRNRKVSKRLTAGLAIAWVAVAAATALALHSAQAGTRSELRAGYVKQAALTAEVASAYTRELAQEELNGALSRAGSGAPTAAEVTHAIEAFGVSAATSLHLRNAAPVEDNHSYLLNGTAIVASGESVAGETDFRIVDNELAKATLAGGTRSGTTGDRIYTVQGVPGTDLRLVMAAPAQSVYAPVAGIRGTGAWLAWATLSLLSLAFAIIAAQMATGRDRRRAADLDRVTELPNHRSTTETLTRALDQEHAEQPEATVLMIDIDHFSMINDAYGHDAGDDVLHEVAARLRNCLREGDSVGRWGGEEFLAVLSGARIEEAERIAERLRAAIAEESFEIDGDLVDVTVSVGCATWGGEPADALVDRADEALADAKAGGRNSVVFV